MDSHIGEPDPPVQDRLLALFEHQLGYTYLGSYEYRSNVRNIEREKLYDYLKSTTKWIPEWEEKMNFFPIPNSEIYKNPNLNQNNGWN